MIDEIQINIRSLTKDDREDLLFLLNNSTFLIPCEINDEAIEIIERFEE